MEGKRDRDGAVRRSLDLLRAISEAQEAYDRRQAELRDEEELLLEQELPLDVWLEPVRRRHPTR